MRLLVTGSQGFIGKNLNVRLNELSEFKVEQFDRGDDLDTLSEKILQVDAIIHLAGENRPKDVADFEKVNASLTESLCDRIRDSGRKIPLIFASSIQAELDNPYGKSKRQAEKSIEKLVAQTDNPAIIYRLPNVFGKWCKPNYNSVVATFCHNVANDLPIQINDESSSLRLVYVDDLVSAFLNMLDSKIEGIQWPRVNPEYSTTLGELASQIKNFKDCRNTLVVDKVGTGLVRALYASYVSYFPKNKFVYDIPSYGDERGLFVEMLKTSDSGQFSYFTAHPGITRGGHYHHTKSEKFLVIKGSARFGFRDILTNEKYEILTSGEVPQVVETIPGWTHDITNVGDDELVVMLWANEIFDRTKPDTIACEVKK